MPAVATYWQMPQDESDFLAFLLSTGNVMAVREQAETKAELEPRPFLEYIREVNPNQVFLGLEQYARTASLGIRMVDGNQQFSIASMSACLISYSRGRIRDGDKLTQSNMAAYWDYPNEDTTAMVEKDHEFVKWGKAVFSWVHKSTPVRLRCNSSSYPATRRVRDAVEAGSLELVLY